MPDIRAAVPESRELVEQGLMSATDYRGNIVDLWGGSDPEFFSATRIAGAAGAHLARRREAAGA